MTNVRVTDNFDNEISKIENEIKQQTKAINNLAKPAQNQSKQPVVKDQVTTDTSKATPADEATHKAPESDLAKHVNDSASDGWRKREAGLKQQPLVNEQTAGDWNKWQTKLDVDSSKAMAVNKNISEEDAGQGAKGAKAQTAAKGETLFDGLELPEGDSAAYQAALAVDDELMSTWDSIIGNEQKGKKLMMMFFYLARMLESSGDLNIAYQFMKILSYIIQKDKSKQMVDSSKKMIELQQLSRQWTEKLFNYNADPNDPNSSSELLKLQTQVKSETDAISTSQKLLSQTMEEFAQVVEMMQNLTKGVLETNGRVLRRLAVFG